MPVFCVFLNDTNLKLNNVKILIKLHLKNLTPWVGMMWKLLQGYQALTCPVSMTQWGPDETQLPRAARTADWKPSAARLSEMAGDSRGTSIDGSEGEPVSRSPKQLATESCPSV